jgi:hypothetical protein
MHLNQHGSFALQVHGDVLLCHIQGDWNDVAVRNLRREAALAWQLLRQRRWGLLLDAQAWGAATPEARHDWEHGFEGDALDAGMACMAAVLPSNFHRQMVRDHTARLAARCAYQPSPDLAAAWAWLATQGLRVG